MVKKITCRNSNPVENQAEDSGQATTDAPDKQTENNDSLPIIPGPMDLKQRNVIKPASTNRCQMLLTLKFSFTEPIEGVSSPGLNPQVADASIVAQDTVCTQTGSEVAPRLLANPAELPSCSSRFSGPRSRLISWARG